MGYWYKSKSKSHDGRPRYQSKEQEKMMVDFHYIYSSSLQSNNTEGQTPQYFCYIKNDVTILESHHWLRHYIAQHEVWPMTGCPEAGVACTNYVNNLM